MVFTGISFCEGGNKLPELQTLFLVEEHASAALFNHLRSGESNEHGDSDELK